MLVESDICDASADRVRAVYKIDPLDGPNRLDKVFLRREELVNRKRRASEHCRPRYRPSSGVVPRKGPFAIVRPE